MGWHSFNHSPKQHLKEEEESRASELLPCTWQTVYEPSGSTVAFTLTDE